MSPRRPQFRRFGSRVMAVAITLLLAGAAVRMRAGDFIVVSAQAIPQYARPKATNGRPQPQSYAFTEGKHFGANLKDRSDEQTRFRSVVESLAPSLAKQSYFPATVPTAADLLIVIHWGTTKVYEDPNRSLQIEQMNSALSAYTAGADAAGNNDPGRLNELNAEMNDGAATQQSLMNRNAELLGYKRSLRERSQRIFASAEEWTMRHELNEERYFIVLMAYDYGILRKEKRRHLLWTTHMSVRSAGTNFRIALPQLSFAAAQYFGQDIADPRHIEVNEKEARIEIGEATVVPDEPKQKD